MQTGREVEPITLHSGRDVQHFLEREPIRWVILVGPMFRSRRLTLVYGATPSGLPVAGGYSDSKTETTLSTIFCRAGLGLVSGCARGR